MPLNIYKIVRMDDDSDRVGPGEAFATIVVASDVTTARNVARHARGDQRPSVWHLSATSVTLVGQAAPLLIPQVLLTHVRGA